MIIVLSLIIMIYICSIMNIYQIVRIKELKMFNRIIWVLMAITLLMVWFMNDQSFLNFSCIRKIQFLIIIIKGKVLFVLGTN